MSRSVLFNGAVLVRPGAATKIDASQFENIALGGIGTVAIIGEADGGPPHSLQVFSGQSGAGGIKNMFRSGDIVEAAQILVDPGNDDRIPTGAQQIVVYKINASTPATLVKAPHAFKSLDWGLFTNNITVALSAGATGNGRVISITGLDADGILARETSPSLGDTGKFTIQYTGAGSAATMTITATHLTTTVTGATGDNLNIDFGDYRDLQAVLSFIGNQGSYTVVSLVTNIASFDPTFLDAVAAVDIKTAPTSVMSSNYDILDWVNKNSQIIYDDSTAFTKGTAGTTAVFLSSPLAGGSRGTSTNQDWINGFSALGAMRINQVVPLCSADATTAQGTYTYDAVLAALAAHCKLMSSTVGRNERQGWSGAAKNKAGLISAANTQNTSALVLLGEKLHKFIIGAAQIGPLPEWAMACALAGMRAGAALGEPLTWKYVNALGVSCDTSWSPGNDGDVVDMTLNGVTVVVPIPGKGFRIDKCITTYTRTDNDAFTEETIVQIWKNVAYELRRALEDRFTGRPGTVAAVKSVSTIVTALLQRFIDEGALISFRNITVGLQGDRLYVGVTVTPTPGVNYILNTLVLIPASISA